MSEQKYVNLPGMVCDVLFFLHHARTDYFACFRVVESPVRDMFGVRITFAACLYDICVVLSFTLTCAQNTYWVLYPDLPPVCKFSQLQCYQILLKSINI